MSKLVVGLLAFVGGVAVGLYAAKLYAEKKTDDVIHNALDRAGLAGGTVEGIAKSILTPLVVG